MLTALVWASPLKAEPRSETSANARPAIEVLNAAVEPLSVHGTAIATVSLYNRSQKTVRLLDVQSEVFGSMTFEEIRVGHDEAKRVTLRGALLPPGELIQLRKGKQHIVFGRPRGPIPLGGTVKASLVFDNGEILPVAFRVTDSKRAPTAEMARTHQHAPQGHGDLNKLRESARLDVPVLDVELRQADASTWLVNLRWANIKFVAPDPNSSHVPGEGHAHILLDGRKVARVSEPTYVLRNVAPGVHTLEAQLFGNDHVPYGVCGRPVSHTKVFYVKP